MIIIKKVLIEFFDEENLNNCISQLHEKFDKVICFYFKEQKNERNKILFESFTAFNRTRAGTEPEYVLIEEKDISHIINKLGEITNETDSFRFDITGGPELFIVAAGLFAGLNQNISISIRQYDIRTGRVTVSYPDENPSIEKDFTLSVKEIVRLHGSMIEEGQCQYDLKKDNLEDNITKLWNAVKDKTTNWNKFCSLKNSRTCVNNNKTVFYKKTKTEAEKAVFRDITKALTGKNLITFYPSVNFEGYPYSAFVSQMPYSCDFLFEKAGNILEMLSYIAIRKTNPEANVLVGVPVDWDGRITGEEGETKNEIDLIVSDGRIPIFISCKNTDVTNDYLYELQTVALHYGGKFAKPVLVSSVENKTAIHKRAEAMGITLVDNVSDMKPDTFFKKLSAACFPDKN